MMLMQITAFFVIIGILGTVYFYYHLGYLLLLYLL